MKKLIIALSLLATMLIMHSAFAEPVAVIVNSVNAQNVSMAAVKNIYMDKTIAWANGKKIAVHNLPQEDVAAEVFSRALLGISARDAATAESNRIVTNVARNPQQTKRAALVSSIVAKTPNAIGYIPSGQASGKTGIRVLFTLE